MKAQFIVTIEGSWTHNDKRITKRKAEQELRAAVSEWFEFLADRVKVEPFKDVSTVDQNTIKTDDSNSAVLSRCKDAEIRDLRARVAELASKCEQLEAEKAAVPAAAGNALTDDDIEEFAERMEASDPKDSFWKEFARMVEQHLTSNASDLRAAPQAAQGEEVTEALDTLRKVERWISREVPIGTEGALTKLRQINAAIEAIAAHTSAAGQGKDSEDAKRYRYLRTAGGPVLEGKELDAVVDRAIDAAMKAGAQGGGNV